jgi:hypothetical protein
MRDEGRNESFNSFVSLVNRRRKHCGSVASLVQVHVFVLKARYFMKHLHDKIFKSAATC